MSPPRRPRSRPAPRKGSEERQRATTVDLPSVALVQALAARVRERARALGDPARQAVERELRPLERAIWRWAAIPPSEPSIAAAMDILVEIDRGLEARGNQGAPGRRDDET